MKNNENWKKKSYLSPIKVVETDLGTFLIGRLSTVLKRCVKIKKLSIDFWIMNFSISFTPAPELGVPRTNMLFDQETLSGDQFATNDDYQHSLILKECFADYDHCVIILTRNMARNL